MPGTIAPNDSKKDNPNLVENTANRTVDSSENSEQSERTDEPTLTDKLNKRLLCSYLQRLKDEDPEVEDNSNNQNSDNDWS